MGRKIKDLTGQRFGRLVAVKPTRERRNRGVVWQCKCDCGNSCKVGSSNLSSGRTQSCGCYNRQRMSLLTCKNISGQRFGRLVAVKSMEKRTGGKTVWECLCDCGNSCKVALRNLMRGTTRSCGCLKGDAVRGRPPIKDLSGNRFGRLVALEPTTKRKNNFSVVWVCMCDCGGICEVSSEKLVRGNTQSCGCLQCKGSVYLYSFRSSTTGLIKLGISGNVRKRQKDLEETLQDNLTLLGYRLSTRSEENEIHKQLKPYKAKHPHQPKGREWFYPAPVVISLAESLGNVYE